LLSQGYSVKIYDVSGTGRLDFYYRSLNSINFGITLNNYTTYNVQFVDSAGLTLTVDGMALYVKSSYSNFDPDYGATPIDLDKMRISTISTNGGIDLPSILLSDTFQPLCYWPIADSGLGQTVNASVSISYNMGALTNMSTGFFTSVLDFELKQYTGIP